MIGIYKIRNKVNGKCYIGQSKYIERRFTEHKRHYNYDEFYHYPLYRAIRKYGIDNFTFEVIKECRVDQLDELEAFYIEYYNSLKNGYNSATGGSNSSIFRKISPKELEELTKLLKNSDLSFIELAERFNVEPKAISRINNGKAHKRDLDYPIRNKSKTNFCIDCRKEISAASKRCLQCSGKSKVIKHYCLDCEVEISRNSKRCKSCGDIYSRKVIRPDKDTLLSEVAILGYAGTGRKYGVVPSTIRYWCKCYGLPNNKKEIVALFNE